MKKNRIKQIRIHPSSKQAPTPIREAINRLHINWLEKELTLTSYDKNTKIKLIDQIAENLSLDNLDKVV